MYANELQRELINWTVLHSGNQPKRGYIGLSGIADCERVIYERYVLGSRPSLEEHLKYKIANELEASLIARLKEINLYSPGETIELFDGLVQGHTDGVIKGQDLLEIKTVPLEEYIPRHGKLPQKVYWQVQAYLHYTGREWAHVVYLARDTGVCEVIGHRQQDRMAVRVQAKLERMVEAVSTMQRPACTCGRCS